MQFLSIKLSTMLLQTYIFLAIICSVSSNNENYGGCGWLYGNVCPSQFTSGAYFPQPSCIDINLCVAPPFNPICGEALPLCPSSTLQNAETAGSSSLAVSKTLPTLPPINDSHPVEKKKEPDQGFAVGNPLIYLPPEGGNAALPVKALPSIINAPVSSITIKEKEPLKLTCSVDTKADPSARITWIREKDKSIVGEGETLLLDNIKQSDAGNYSCKAQNGNAVAATVLTKVNVECPPRTSGGIDHSVITAKSGENVTLTCETNCFPEPQFSWYRDEEPDKVLQTCEPLPLPQSLIGQQNQGTGEERSICELRLAATPGDKLTCKKTSSLGTEQQTFEIKAASIAQRRLPPPIQLSLPAVDSSHDFDTVGCYTRCYTTPNLPELLFVDNGQTDRNDDSLGSYIIQFVNRCAKEAETRGFDYFGITSYDQCFSGDQTVKTTYDFSGPSDQCITGEFKPCTPDDTYCLGQCSSMFVYKFKESNSANMGKRRTMQRRVFKPRLRQCSKLKKFLETKSKILLNGMNRIS